jgi:hypothetical protein
MHYAPRTIAFVCDLQHPVISPDPGPIQKIHNQMFESGTPTYSSFNVTHEGAVLSNPTSRPDAISSVTFQANRMLFREELTGMTVETFGRRVREVAQLVAPLRGVQVFVAQQVTLRSLVNPRRFRDSRECLREGLMGLGDELEAFEREPQLFGVRLVFPATPEHPQYYSLRIESFHQDPRSLFLENQGTFTPIVVARGLEVVEENVTATYEFLVQRALRFVATFDARAET